MPVGDKEEGGEGVGCSLEGEPSWESLFGGFSSLGIQGRPQGRVLIRHSSVL